MYHLGHGTRATNLREDKYRDIFHGNESGRWLARRFVFLHGRVRTHK